VSATSVNTLSMVPAADYVIDWSVFDDKIGWNAGYRIHRDRLMGRSLHTHDGFEEMFLVDGGRAVHDLNGRDYPLIAGDLVFVHTTDVHRFRSPSADFALINLSMPVGTMALLHHRYVPDRSTAWMGAPSRLHHLSSQQAGRLLVIARGLCNGSATQLEIDRFLIEVVATVHPRTVATYRFPPWLVESFTRWTDSPAAMAGGVTGLARLACRSREHVSRVIRQSTGKRAVDVLNEVRMKVASDRLQMTNRPISLIAAEVGLPNVSHFYRVFRRTFATTPRRFRADHLSPGVRR
jgi:AraC family cel operon transcriptional repressor